VSIAGAPVALEPDRVRSLLRFGWAIAELRGRANFGPSDPGRLISEMGGRAGHSLPLAEERSWRELLFETHKVVCTLAETLVLELDGSKMEDSQGRVPSGPTLASKRVVDLCNDVYDGKGKRQSDAEWNAFAEALYMWDADIQDKLACSTFGEGSAYQLGRALAESTWSLDPTSNPASNIGWLYLLGTNRCLAITRLIDRLTPVFGTLTAQAVKSSITNWRDVARNPEWRDGEVGAQYLRAQAIAWRDLLVGGTDPTLLVRPTSAVKQATVVWSALRSLWPQLVAAVVSVLAVAGGAWVMSQKSLPGLLGAFVTALGGLGVTASALSTRAKAMAKNLVSSISAAITADLVIAAVSETPPPPSRQAKSEPGRLALAGSHVRALGPGDLDRSGL